MLLPNFGSLQCTRRSPNTATPGQATRHTGSRRAGITKNALIKRGVWNNSAKLKRELVNAGVRAQNIKGAQWATILEKLLESKGMQ